MSGTKDVVGIYQKALTLLCGIPDLRLGLQMVEIYQDQIVDLLHDREKVRVRLNGLSAQVERIETISRGEALLDLGLRQRRNASTKMNENSSRSHLIVQFVVGSVQRPCTLLLVDLAGSERVEKAQVTGERLKEAQSINRSLSALSNVMMALQSQQSHIPYRNSKLTQVLQPALTKDSIVMMLVHVHPGKTHAKETLCTLHLGARVRSIPTTPEQQHAREAYQKLEQKVSALVTAVAASKTKLQTEKQQTEKLRKELTALENY